LPIYNSGFASFDAMRVLASVAAERVQYPDLLRVCRNRFLIASADLAQAMRWAHTLALSRPFDSNP
jgi:hypothetical protein